jgi:hypothetical protein
MESDLVTFLIDRRSFLNIAEIARLSGIPEGTLLSVVGGHRKLPCKYRDDLLKTLKELGLIQDG